MYNTIINNLTKDLNQVHLLAETIQNILNNLTKDLDQVHLLVKTIQNIQKNKLTDDQENKISELTVKAKQIYEAFSELDKAINDIPISGAELTKREVTIKRATMDLEEFYNHCKNTQEINLVEKSKFEDENDYKDYVEATIQLQEMVDQNSDIFTDEQINIIKEEYERMKKDFSLIKRKKDKATETMKIKIINPYASKDNTKIQ